MLCRGQLAVVRFEIDAFGLSRAGRVELALVDVGHTLGARVPRVAFALVTVHQIDAFAVDAARRRLAFIDFDLAIDASVAGLALAPVAGRLGVVKVVLELIHFDHVRRRLAQSCAVRAEIAQIERRVSRAAQQLNSPKETVLVRVLPAYAVHTRR